LINAAAVKMSPFDEIVNGGVSFEMVSVRGGGIERGLGGCG